MRIPAIILSLLISNLVSSQTTIVIQPNACEGKDAIVAGCVPCGFYNTNYGEANELSAIAWTASGTTSLIRALIQFDLSEIPVNASVSDAKLSLYHNPTGSNPGHSQLSGSNEGYIKRVTSSWDETTVTWETQPTVTSQDQVLLPASLNDTQDYIDIDVTILIQEMVDNPSQNFGMMLQLQNEDYYRSLLFASSDHLDQSLRPKLEITFSSSQTNPTTCLAIQPGNSECSQGKDAIVASCIPCGFHDTNYGGAEEISAIAWTVSNSNSIIRGLLEFDLSSIPSNATIISSDLSLYYNPTSGNPGHSQLSGSNETLIQRITSNWDEATVTWDDQPTSTTQNQITLPASQTDTQDYPNIDVTAMVQDMVSNPSQNFGFMFRLVNEDYYRSMMFASSDHPNASLWPKLDICYSTNASGISDHSQNDGIRVYPNPASNSFVINLGEYFNKAELIIHNVLGKIVFNQNFNGNRLNIENAEFQSGVYLITVKTNNSQFTERLIIK